MVAGFGLFSFFHLLLPSPSVLFFFLFNLGGFVLVLGVDHYVSVVMEMEWELRVETGGVLVGSVLVLVFFYFLAKLLTCCDMRN